MPEYTLRSRPGDFRVKEVMKIAEKSDGKYGIYKLSKTNLDTFGALKIVARRTGVPLKSIGYSGLKDRYSVSEQYVSIPRDARERLNFSEKNLSLRYVCNSAVAIRLGSHEGNFFTITLRKMNRETFDKLKRSTDIIGKLPIPNYFDSQRFGSIRGGREFFVKSLLRKNYEDGLKLMLTGTHERERVYIKKIKKYLAANWGDWGGCVEYLRRQKKYESYLKIFYFLKKHPNDFKGAIKLAPRDTLMMGISAFQSYIWNECLKQFLASGVGEENLSSVKYEAGELYFPKPEKKNFNLYRDFFAKHSLDTLQFPTHRLNESDKNFSLINSIVRGIGHDLAEFRELRKFDVSLKKAERGMFFLTSDLKIVSDGIDRQAVGTENCYATLSFTLPPGSYATVLIKSLFV